MHLKRLVTVLESVALAGKPVVAADLHDMTDLPLPTCYRLLQALSGEGLLDAEGNKSRYVIGTRLVRIAHLARTDEGIRGSVSTALKEAANEYGEAVFLSRLRHNGVGIIHVETPADESRSYIHPGLGRRPLHACSCSKAIAAFADGDFRSMILNGALKPYTDNTQTSKEALELEYDNIVRLGYAECVEEIELGVASVAVPVQIKDVGVIFSLGMTGPIHRFDPEKRSTIGTEMIHLAQKVGSLVQIGSGKTLGVMPQFGGERP